MLPRPWNRGTPGWRRPLQTPWVEPIQGALPFAPGTSLKASRGRRGNVGKVVCDAPALQSLEAPAGQCVPPKTLDLSGHKHEPQIAIPRRAIAFLRTHPSFRGLGLVPSLAVATYGGAPILYEHFLCPILTDRPTRNFKAQVASAANASGFAIRYVRTDRAPVIQANVAGDNSVPEPPAIAVAPSRQQRDAAVPLAVSATSASSQQEDRLAAQMPATGVGSSGPVRDTPTQLATVTARPTWKEGDRSVPSAAATAATSSQEPDATARMAGAASADLALLLESLPPNYTIVEADLPLQHECFEPEEFVVHGSTYVFSKPDQAIAGQQSVEMRVSKRGRLLPHVRLSFPTGLEGAAFAWHDRLSPRGVGHKKHQAASLRRLHTGYKSEHHGVGRVRVWDLRPGGPSRRLREPGPPPKMNIKASQTKGREITARAQAGMTNFGNIEVKGSSSRVGELAQEVNDRLLDECTR
jgi:hypothetical protein